MADLNDDLLKEIRDLHAQMLSTQKNFLWILLPIFVLLAIQTILGLAGFFSA